MFDKDSLLAITVLFILAFILWYMGAFDEFNITEPLEIPWSQHPNSNVARMFNRMSREGLIAKHRTLLPSPIMRKSGYGPDPFMISVPFDLRQFSSFLPPSLDYSRPVTIAFTSSECPKCKELSRIWDKVAFNMQVGHGQLLWLDCLNFPTLCRNMDIKYYPTIIRFEPGKLPREYRGERTPQAITWFAMGL